MRLAHRLDVEVAAGQQPALVECRRPPGWRCPDIGRASATIGKLICWSGIAQRDERLDVDGARPAVAVLNRGRCDTGGARSRTSSPSRRSRCRTSPESRRPTFAAPTRSPAPAACRRTAACARCRRYELSRRRAGREGIRRQPGEALERLRTPQDANVATPTMLAITGRFIPSSTKTQAQRVYPFLLPSSGMTTTLGCALTRVAAHTTAHAAPIAG